MTRAATITYLRAYFTMEGITINYTPKTPQFAQSSQYSVHPQGQINFSIQNNNMVD